MAAAMAKTRIIRPPLPRKVRAPGGIAPGALSNER